MSYTAQDFSPLLGTPGFSDKLLTAHFKLYEGYVTNTNTALELLGGTLEAGTPAYAEVRRRLGWEFNGMRLHELYFSNMAKEGGELASGSALLQKIEKVFGTVEKWEAEYRATGAARGIGWAILYYDPAGDRLVNVWINEHDAGHFAGCTPVLVMDVFEHAFVPDYGMDRKAYIEAFFKAIHWDEAAKRFEQVAQ